MSRAVEQRDFAFIRSMPPFSRRNSSGMSIS